MKNTKIYNEIILQWNDDTNQFDTVYEDSFDYIGDDFYLFNGDPDPVDQLVCNHDDVQLSPGFECCRHSKFFGAFDESWGELPLAIPANDGSFAATNFCDEGWTLIKISHNGGVNNDSVVNKECCVNNNIRNFVPTNLGEFNYWSGKIPLCNVPDFPGECLDSNGAGWNLDTVVLGFTCTSDEDLDFQPWCDNFVEDIESGLTIT